MKTDGELWALLFFGTAITEVENKIVWRITGTGETPTFEAEHEDGTVIDPFWGPQFHEDSTWERPGDEWGTSFIFPKSGCWVITVTSGPTVGEIVLDVQ